MKLVRLSMVTVATIGLFTLALSLLAQDNEGPVVGGVVIGDDPFEGGNSYNELLKTENFDKLREELSLNKEQTQKIDDILEGSEDKAKGMEEKLKALGSDIAINPGEEVDPDEIQEMFTKNMRERMELQRELRDLQKI